MSTYAHDTSILVAGAMPNERALFIRRTYWHLAGAIAAFAYLEYLILPSSLGKAVARFALGGQYNWLMILGAFMLAGWLARGLAAKVDSVFAQYVGLVLFVLAEAIIFVPLLYLAVYYSDPSVLPNAAILTGLLFAGLTTVAFTTKKDFSFLGGVLTVGGFIALGLIVCSVLFGFTLGLIFSAVMIVFACAAILYDTSKIIHQFTTEQYVAASLELFASVALLFWYVLSIFLRRN